MPLYRSITTTDWRPFQYVAMLKTEDKDCCGTERHTVDKERFSQLVARFRKGDVDKKLATKKAQVTLR